MSCRHDAIVIGGGPAGSTAAILLAQAGWSVALVEKQVFPRRKVCGECIAATNLPLLDELGISEDFHELAGHELRQVALMLGRHTVIADMPALPHGRHAWGRALTREHLDTLLLQRAKTAGAQIFQPWSVRHISGGFGDYSCEIASAGSAATRMLQAPVIIAACGSWEPQSFMQSEKPPKLASDLFAFKANFQGAHLPAGLLPVLSFAGGYGGMVREGSGIMTLACCIRRDTLKACRARWPNASAAEAVEAYLRASCAGVEQALAGATRLGAWLSVGPLRPGIRVGNRGHEFFLVGNAAAEAHPIIGEGISMAMQSSWLLCRKLISCRNKIDASLMVIDKDYTRDWRRHFAARLRLASLFAHLAMRPRLGNALLPILQRWPGLITHGAYLSGKVRPLEWGPLHEELA